MIGFSSPTKDVKAKSLKTKLLRHLVTGFSLNDVVKSLSSESIQLFLDMFSMNVFLPYPFIQKRSLNDTHDSIQNAAWPHISLVYEAFLNSFVCPSVNHFSFSFINSLINNLISPDDRERNIVKNITVQLFHKFHSTKEQIQQSIHKHFFNQKCSSELIQVYFLIVNEFSIPLSSEKIQKFHNLILPLHSLNNFTSYSRDLTQIIIRYIAKELSLLDLTLNYLFQHWPITNLIKTQRFLDEIEEIMITFEPQIKTQYVIKFFNQIANCCKLESSDLIFSALDILQNRELSGFIKNNSNIIYNHLVIRLNELSKNSWDEDVQDNAKYVLELLKILDESAYKKAIEIQKFNKVKKINSDEICKSNWKKIFDVAKSTNLEFSDSKFSTLPF